MDQSQLFTTADELQYHMNGEEPPTVIDVRPHDQYEKGHLPGAVNIEKDELAGRVDEVPLGKPVVVYCNMHHPGSSSSEAAAKMLKDMKYQAHVLKGGYPEWVKDGKPIERETQLSK